MQSFKCQVKVFVVEFVGKVGFQFGFLQIFYCILLFGKMIDWVMVQYVCDIVQFLLVEWCVFIYVEMIGKCSVVEVVSVVYFDCVEVSCVIGLFEVWGLVWCEFNLCNCKSSFVLFMFEGMVVYVVICGECGRFYEQWLIDLIDVDCEVLNVGLESIICWVVVSVLKVFDV